MGFMAASEHWGSPALRGLPLLVQPHVCSIGGAKFLLPSPKHPNLPGFCLVLQQNGGLSPQEACTSTEPLLPVDVAHVKDLQMLPGCSTEGLRLGPRLLPFPQPGSRSACLLPDAQVSRTPPGFLSIQCWVLQLPQALCGQMSDFSCQRGAKMKHGLCPHNAGHSAPDSSLPAPTGEQTWAIPASWAQPFLPFPVQAVRWVSNPRAPWGSGH